MNSPWTAAAAGAFTALSLAALIWQRERLWQAARSSPQLAAAAITLTASLVWLATLAGRRQTGPALAPPPQEPARPAPPTPHEIDYAPDLPLDTSPDPDAPLAVDPDPDIDELVRRLDARAQQRAGSTD